MAKWDVNPVRFQRIEPMDMDNPNPVRTIGQEFGGEEETHKFFARRPEQLSVPASARLPAGFTELYHIVNDELSTEWYVAAGAAFQWLLQTSGR